MGTSKKTNKILFFLGNTAIQGLLLAAIARNGGFSWLMLLPLALCVFLSYLLTVAKSPEDAPACRHLVTNLFLDCCLLLVLRGRVLLQMRDPSLLRQNAVAGGSTAAVLSWAVLAVGVLLLFLGMKSPKRAAWVPLGCGVLGAVTVLPRWCGGLPKTLRFLSGGEGVVLAFLLFAVLWYVSYQVVLAAAPEKYGELNTQTVLVYAVVLVINLLEPDYLRYCVSPTATAIYGALTTWKCAIPLAVLLCLCVATAAKDDEEHYRPDTLVAFGLTGLLLFLVLLFHWAPASLPAWLLFLGMAESTSVWLRNGFVGKRTLRLKADEYLGFQFPVFALVLGAVIRGLWPTLAVTLAFAILFYAQFDRMRAKPRGNLLWLSVLAFLAAEAAAVRVFRGITAAHAAMLGAITLAAALCLLLLNWPHPSGRSTASNGLRAAVCGGAAVLLALVALAC